MYRSIPVGAGPRMPGLIVWKTGPAAASLASDTTRARRSTGSGFDAESAGSSGERFLSLGRVHNIASVRLNGHDLGVAWCDPWRVSISGRGVED